MTDYHSPTVVQPNIPPADMTPLERLILDLAFDAESETDGIYFHSECGPSDIVTLSVEDLRTAFEASRDRGESSIGKYVSALLTRHDEQAGDDPPDDIDVDLTDSENGWDQMFQDIVRRSATIDEIVVTSAFTCTRMRPNGFGGSVMLITADAIRYCSTADMLEKFWNEAAKASPNPRPTPSERTS
ncbi:hypothetical protein OCA5_pHCG300870 (plasmid) [Afipia carboxidovorans OM5]|uniref:Uncharacterized protein n=1 Tax=Afipia carboxidovorans (strain ATCC 49405 / DSM 1227 / KCTC 32145 / OM5) TaxID=504832 RepID=Q6LB71_AFIC5|nr:hypothetical protein [Afipia carboxidovorans]AEI04532.1 hypothetical protein OCA4_pHCG3B00870 [Afipia carboxidovorans OM4]AEI08160.1 hypothetical protein OCA5_pHCG300870 [Afipia carboxidovorans OM5]